VRGLKQGDELDFYKSLLVAPRAGAWIETSRTVGGNDNATVVPRAGAWIETLTIQPNGSDQQVAPRTGAWIETVNILLNRYILDRALKL